MYQHGCGHRRHIMNISDQLGRPADKDVFRVKEPGMHLTKAIQRMETALPVPKPLILTRKLPPIGQLPRPVAHVAAVKGMMARKNIPELPSIPAFQPSKIDIKSFLDDDDDLRDLLTKRSVRTLVVGVGGAGNNMVSRFQEAGIPGCRTMVVNTDVQDLYFSNADEKVLIGKRLTKGLGSGNNHEIGELAALEDYERLKAVFNADIVFLSCGLGGGTGTGATPVIARAARDSGAIVVSVVTMPFEMEGPTKQGIATEGLKQLAVNSDTTIPLTNQRLFSLVPDIKLHQGFKIMDEILMRSVRGVIDLTTKPGLVNLDFADIKSVIEKHSDDINQAIYSTSVIGMTEVSKVDESNLAKYTTKALQNPLIDPDVSGIKNALVGIMGDFNVSLKQVNAIVSTVQQQIHPSANVKWGYIQAPEMNGKVRITVLGNGFKSQLLDDAINGIVA